MFTAIRVIAGKKKIRKRDRKIKEIVKKERKKERKRNKQIKLKILDFDGY